MRGKNDLPTTKHQYCLFKEEQEKLKLIANKKQLSINEYCRRVIRNKFLVNSHINLDIKLKELLDKNTKETGETFEDIIRAEIKKHDLSN